jgi:glycosyltransferase involved in cell wall biosynthesis
MMSTVPAMGAQSDGRPAGGGLTVCHVFSGDLWAGAEVVILNLLTCLNDDPGLRVLALSLNEGELTARLRTAGIATQVIPEAQHGMLGVLARATAALRGAGVSVLHSHRYKENVLAWLLARRLHVREIVTTMHGMPEAPTTSVGQMLRARGRAGLDFFVLRRFFSRVVAVSDEMKRALVDAHGFRADQVEVIRNGGRFPSQWRPSRTEGEPLHIGTVSRMVPVKGLELFLDAAAALRQREPGLRFSILGDGPLREALWRRVEALGIADCTEFLAPRPDAFGYYASLDVYVNTSLHEGLPLSIVEAMAAGLPIVSAAVGGIPEVVTDGEHGFLLEGRDASRFADACLALVRDTSLRAAMGRRATASAHARLSAAAMADAYRRLYEHVAGVRRWEPPVP